MKTTVTTTTNNTAALPMLKVDGIERFVPASETIAFARPLAESLGVTRLADITGLDRVGIPVYSAVVPDSPDALSVYNGKGVRPVDAKAGALMEAIERQLVLKTRLPLVEASFAHLSRRARASNQSAAVLDPRSINSRLAASYSEDRPCSWCEGLDIVSGQPCHVPARLAGYLWRDVPHPSCFAKTDSNGLASGNSREEAICHALCELAERDSWTFVELGAHVMPRARRSFALGPHARSGPDDLEIFPCVDLGAHELLVKFHAANLFPIVRNITSALGIPAFFATMSDESITGYPMAHCGLGAHPNAEVAVRRALLELAQSRCVDIQAVREDITPPGATRGRFSPHTRRIDSINRHSWYHAPSKHLRKLADIPSHAFPTIEEDLQFLLDRFRAAGLDQIIVVDFTPNATAYSVVRVIVPGIENWALDHGRFGPRALAFWKQHA
ncbi:MAG TPA: YcaO-like family protein [Acidobacteriaceae bacterium]|nr:YcaO-like family protein [Acidobacteriaceae bacterium]